MKTKWNLNLLYKSEKDSKLEQDLALIERKTNEFEAKYRGQDFTSTPALLRAALDELEAQDEELERVAPAFYFSLRTDLDATDQQAQALGTKYGQRLAKMANQLEFFPLAIGKIASEKQSAYLADPILQPYRYLLARAFLSAKYHLSEPEEQLINLLSQPSASMWVDGQERLLNQQTIKHKGKNLALPAVRLEAYSKKEREDLQKKLNEKYKAISFFAESEINAVYNYKKILDEKRGFAKPYSATILDYENDEKAIEALIALITKNFKIAHRFYRLHAKILGERKITYADRNVKAGKIKKKFDFDSAVEIVTQSLSSVEPGYGQILTRYLENGQIDVYPRQGKTGGAYCASMGLTPTFVLLNHTNDLRSVETLAHEMGHAIHGELGKAQPARYRGHSIATAEVASTFFEQVAGLELEQLLSQQEQIIFLHNKIAGDISTIFRQVACFNYERELHERIRAAGEISAAEMAKLLAKHLRSYLGPAVQVSDDDGYFFVNWSHIRRPFYVYSYAYGQIISKALLARWQADQSYAQQVRQFLEAGRSASPEQIFQNIGIDVANPAFFAAGLEAINRDITRLEKLL